MYMMRRQKIIKCVINFCRKYNNKYNLFVVMIIFIFYVIGCGSKQRMYRVGILSGSDAFLTISDGFKTQMAGLGFIEGRNIRYEIHAFNADPAGEQGIVRKFVSDKVDLIVAFPTEPAVAAKKGAEEAKIPVVFISANIEGNNLVKSVSHPGGNCTGVRYPGSDLTVKRLEILLELAPHVKRLNIIYDPHYPAIPPSLERLRPAVSSLGLVLMEDSVNSVNELQKALQKRTRSGDIGIDAILIMPETLTQSPEGWALISRFAEKHHIPIAGSAAFEADSGAVFSYIPDNVEQGRLAASMAVKILKGFPPGDIFVITPVSRLRLNYKLAQKLGLKVSDGLLSQAAEVIR